MYADIIYPAIYDKKYEEPVQLSMEDSDELDTSISTIDRSNRYARDKGKFKQGNKMGVRFASKEDNNDNLKLSDIKRDNQQ